MAAVDQVHPLMLMPMSMPSTLEYKLCKKHRKQKKPQIWKKKKNLGDKSWKKNCNCNWDVLGQRKNDRQIFSWNDSIQCNNMLWNLLIILVLPNAMTYNFNLDYSSQYYALSVAFYLPYIFQLAVILSLFLAEMVLPTLNRSSMGIFNINIMRTIVIGFQPICL